MTYRRTYTLKALKKGLGHFVDKYRWTGQGSPVPSSLIRDQQIRLTEIKNVWQFFEVWFPRNLQKGEALDVDIQWKLEDPDRKAIPFILGYH